MRQKWDFQVTAELEEFASLARQRCFWGRGYPYASPGEMYSILFDDLNFKGFIEMIEPGELRDRLQIVYEMLDGYADDVSDLHISLMHKDDSWISISKEIREQLDHIYPLIFDLRD